VPVTSSRTPSRRADDGRRAELIAAASRVIARDGIAAATTRRIAEEAGAPAGLVHYWFAGKDELLEEVVAAVLGSIETAIVAADAAEGGTSLLGRLRAAFRAVEQDEPGRQLALYEMTTMALRKPELTHVAEQQYTAYRRAATDAVTAWLEATGARLPADTAVLGQLIAVLFDGLVLAWLADPEHTDVDGVLTLLSKLIEQYAAIPPQTPQP